MLLREWRKRRGEEAMGDREGEKEGQLSGILGSTELFRGLFMGF